MADITPETIEKLQAAGVDIKPETLQLAKARFPGSNPDVEQGPSPAIATQPAPAPAQDDQQLPPSSGVQAVPAAAQAGQDPSAIKLASDKTAAAEIGGQNPVLGMLTPGMQATAKAYDDAANATAQGAKAQMAKAVETAKVLDEGQQQIKNINDKALIRQADQDKQYNDQLKKRDEALADYQKAEVDPQRLFHNMSTGQKLTAGVGLLLGSFGSGSQNTAVSVMKDAIDQDINAQKANLDKKGQVAREQSGVLSEMRAKFGDERAAEAATRMAYMDQLKLKIESTANKYASPEIKANAQKSIAMLDMEYAKSKQEFESQIRVKMARANLNGGISSQIDNNMLMLPADEQDKMQARRVTGDGVDGIARSPERAKALQEAVNSTETNRTAIRDLVKLGNENGRQVLPSEVSAKAAFLTSFLTTQAREQLVGGRAMTEADIGLLKNLVANPTLIRQVNAKAVLVKLDQALKWKLDNQLKGEGLKIKSLDLGKAVD